ncbi:Rv3235 family protein [Kitasatospora azatica]|uniref:Rv3235 family protein n=1 Tax=Kitasatospora azatica TaxID=58347 RepID=UPI00068AE042|nr:Rv3235 family protein [Kitasatospora azatica]
MTETAIRPATAHTATAHPAATPPASAPTIAPTISAPTIAPTISAPTITAPTISAPTITAPTISALAAAPRPAAGPLPRHRPAPPRAPRQPRAACGPAGGDGRDSAGRKDLARRFALRLVEVLAGVRPAGQLVRHTTHDGYRQLARLVHGGPLRQPGAALPRLGPVHDSTPAPGALEVCVRVEAGIRHHMVAFRLERHRRTDQWQCAAVEAR